MRWPFDTRVDAAHAWGTVTGGIAIIGIVVGALAATHSSDPHFHWWWPTNWLSIPAGIVLIGLILATVPFRRKIDHRKEESQRSQERFPVPQTLEQNITANSPGAIAQGAVFGNVINYPRRTDDRPAGSGSSSGGEQP